MGRLLIVSNRLPFTVEKTGDEITVRQSSGGLVSAIISFFEKGNAERSSYSEKVWVGSIDTSEEDWKKVQETGAIKSEFEIGAVFIEKKVYDHYYNGFSNSTLWPLFHYFPSLVEYQKEYFDAYVTANNIFADRILSIYQPGDVIWVHDYQLMLVPHLVREKLPDATIGFFLHIPFPSYELFRLLPTGLKRELLKGILGADLIGFHTHDYVQHFIQSAKMILQVENTFNNIQYNNRIIKADLFPIGIDYQKFRNMIRNEMVEKIIKSLETKFLNQKIIFSVDRLDYTKGLNHRLRGFEEFLARNPDWIENVVFILNIIPSRDVIPAYVDRKKEIEEMVSTINGKYSSLHWQPIIYRYNHLAFDELCSLYQTADVALITPLRDGMNLVAKEYIASCVDKGVLILSEFTGAASELNEAIQVNPTDTEEVANAIATALDMPLTDQRSRLLYMQQRIADYNVVNWLNDFLNVLNETKKEQHKQKVNLLTDETVGKIVEQYWASQKRCILLDYDGTLSPYQKIPSMATPGKDLLQLLEGLSNTKANEVVVISGRDADTLDKWLGHLPLTLVAEHGACIKYKNENWQQQVSITPEWKEQIRPLLELFVTRCAGSFIEEKSNTLVWHYRNTHPDLGFNRSRELRNSLLQLTGNTNLQVIDGNKVLEVRQVGIDKGVTALKIIKHYTPDFILTIGDDTTDEDMFKVLRETAHTIKVGSGNTAARYTIMKQTDVLPLLQRFFIQVKKPELSVGE